MTSPRKTEAVIIVGGGATGVILAAHLLRSPVSSLRVTLVERRGVFGEGLAYSTPLPDHLLNVSDRGMSAFADDPKHFSQWARANGLTASGEPFFASRGDYGRYLRSLVETLAEQEPVRLRLLQGEATAIKPSASGVEVALANGASLVGRVAVLATGHDEGPSSAYRYAVKPAAVSVNAVPPSSRVLILGTGLSMVDAYLSLKAQGHVGEVVAVSRRGLLPSPHKPAQPVRLDSADIPLGTELSYFVHWLREFIDETSRRGGDWRDAIDGLRPFNQRIWQSWPASAKRRFLEHTKAWWDVHRHRMAQPIYDRVSSAVADGSLRLIAGRVSDVKEGSASKSVTIEHRGSHQAERLDTSLIIDCTGIAKDVSESSNAVIRSLIETGFARPDALRIGLDVTSACAVVDRNGKPTPNLYAAGPLTRGTFFEVDAIAEIRAQCAKLAKLIGG